MSQEQTLPDRVRDFVLRHIDTVGALEALLLLRTEPEDRWTPARLGTRLYVHETVALAVLLALSRHGLVTHEHRTFRYAPVNDALRADVDALAAAYPRFLIPITQLIHAKPSGSLRDFADAFRLREEE
jgi:hypothetical protein